MLRILNGIDTNVWDPATDTYLSDNYDLAKGDEGKAANKKVLCEQFRLDFEKPLIGFIGRLVARKLLIFFPK